MGIAGSTNGSVNGDTNASGSLNGTTGINSANWNNNTKSNGMVSNSMSGGMTGNTNSSMSAGANGTMNTGMNGSMDNGSGTTAQVTVNTNAPMQPYIHLYGSNGSFVGYTGCNRISGLISGSGSNAIHFDNTNPATAIPCFGGNDEQAFLSALQRVNAYSVSNGQLQLMDGTTVVMTFSKNSGNGQ